MMVHKDCEHGSADCPAEVWIEENTVRLLELVSISSQGDLIEGEYVDGDQESCLRRSL